MIAGVVAAFARYLDMDVTIARVLWVALTLLTGGTFLLAYLVSWILIPEEGLAAVAPATAEQKAPN